MRLFIGNLVTPSRSLDMYLEKKKYLYNKKHIQLVIFCKYNAETRGARGPSARTDSIPMLFAFVVKHIVSVRPTLFSASLEFFWFTTLF
jgi:hypothetical protein